MVDKWLHDTDTAVSNESFSPGQQLGPYRVESIIGSGGMGAVYRAEDSRLNRLVAIKVSRAQFSQGFEREAKAVAALNHPSICQIYDIGPNYLVMEYVDGLPVALPDRPLPTEEALRLARQMAAALEAAHGKGIVHRDLKPANILVTAKGVVKLLDFGLAKQEAANATGGAIPSLSMMEPGAILGTPAYMSPEQAEGKRADARSDIFSFGAVLYEMLSGRRAFRANSVASTLGAILYKEPDPLVAPEELSGIALRCLAKTPDARFQTAAELLAALENVSPARQAPPVQGKRSYKAAAAIALSAVILAGGFVAYRKWATRSRRYSFHRCSSVRNSQQRSGSRIHIRRNCGERQHCSGAAAGPRRGTEQRRSSLQG